jgi:hypothetical protein
MPLSRAQVQAFVCDIAENFGLPEPRVSHRRLIRCRFGARTLHLGRTMLRGDLAHELAHYMHKHFAFSDGARLAAAIAGAPQAKKGRGSLGRIHGTEWDRWRKLIGNYIAQEFGPGEGVTL